MRGNILATENQQAIINYVIDVKMGVYLHKTYTPSSSSTREHNLFYMAGSLLDYLLYLHYFNVCRFCCHEFTFEEIG